MATQTQNNGLDILKELHQVVLDYGVRRVSRSTDLEDCTSRLDITYHVLGQGCILSNLISEKMQEIAPDMSYRIKMIPSDTRLVVELF